MSVSREQARAAKQQLAVQLAGVEELNGIGIVCHDDNYGLKVNLIKPVRPHLIPSQIDGVMVHLDVVGDSFPAQPASF
jgi:hypothetical protein